MDKILAAMEELFVVLVVLVVSSIVMAMPTMWLWNWLMPELFGLKMLTFWQALGLNVLTGILFRAPGCTHSQQR